MRIVKSVNNHSLEPGLVFFDIETTGLSAQSAYVYLIGFMRNEDGKCVMTMLFIEDFNEEKEMLEKFISLLSPDETLVHFNGTTFDIPFLNKKFKRHCINYFIDPDKTTDVYKTLTHFKKYFPLENLKLKTVETAAGFKRTDTFAGSDLIELYSELTGKIRLAQITKNQEHIDNAEAIIKVILLHNSDDLLGLLAVYEKTNIEAAKCGSLPVSAEITPFEFIMSVNRPLFPVQFEFSIPEMYINNGSNAAEVAVPVKEGELKYFFNDYKNYTYVIDRDMCMHNSVVGGIAKENKKKCTKATAYIRKAGRFVPLPKGMPDLAAEKHLKLFKESYESKTFYCEIEDIVKVLEEYFKFTILGL